VETDWRKIMPEKFESILRNIAPLVLIIAVSWFFSFLASKARKQTTNSEGAPKQGDPKGLAEVLFEEDDVRQPAVPGEALTASPAPLAASSGRTWQSASVGPKVTPKPITPKWWA
jgi:hypothetical protein